MMQLKEKEHVKLVEYFNSEKINIYIISTLLRIYSPPLFIQQNWIAIKWNAI